MTLLFAFIVVKQLKSVDVAPWLVGWLH